MTTSDTEILSALLDGEPVDADRVAMALEDPAARAALVHFVRLREAVRNDPIPLPASLSAVQPHALSLGRFRWPAVAAALLVMFLAGWFAPRPWNGHAPQGADVPPTPTRVEKFVPGVDWHQSN